VDIPGVHPSERDASQLLRWRQRSSLAHAATPTASCFIDRAPILTAATVLTAAPARAQTYNPDYPVCLQVYGIGGGDIGCG
jgi:hypothetical protein